MGGRRAYNSSRAYSILFIIIIIIIIITIIIIIYLLLYLIIFLQRGGGARAKATLLTNWLQRNESDD